MNSLFFIIAFGAILLLVGVAIGTLYRGRSSAHLFLAVALLVTAGVELCDYNSFTSSNNEFYWKHLALFAEAFLPLCWLAATYTYARWQGLRQIGWMRMLLLLLVACYIAFPAYFPREQFFYSPDFPREPVLFLGNIGYLYYLGIMAFLVLALVNLEATFSNASPDNLYRIKYELIGLGTIVGAMVFYYSQAMLHRTLNMGYVQFRQILYWVAGALILYSHVQRKGEVRIQVSRQVAFKSLVIFIVGMYLVVIGFLGEGMQYFGSSFLRIVAIVLAFLGGVALLVLLGSERIRREMKVLLHKNFYQQKYDYRTQWLQLTEQLASSRSTEELLQRILSSYCGTFGTHGGALFLYRESIHGYGMTACYSMSPIEIIIPADDPLVMFMTTHMWVVNAKDDNPELGKENKHFLTTHGISFVVPLFAEQHLEGFIVLGRLIKENEVYLYEDYDLMKTIARQASLAILHQKLSEQVTQSRELEAIGSVSTFVIHDLKNLVSNLSLIVENAAKYIHNTDFQQDMLASLRSTAEKMQRLIGRLKNLREQEQMHVTPTDIHEIAQRAASTVSGATVSISGSVTFAMLDENEIQKVVVNLIINAVEAMGDNRQPILIDVGTVHDKVFLRVTDSGCGMSSAFIRNDLFQPFKTTKKNGLGIGLFQCRQIIDAHGGRIDVTSSEGVGTTFTLWFPLLRNESLKI